MLSCLEKHTPGILKIYVCIGENLNQSAYETVVQSTTW